VKAPENFEETPPSTEDVEKSEFEAETEVKCDDAEDEQAEDDKEIDNPDGESETGEDEEDYELKCGEMAKEIETLKATNDTYMCELKDLREYKFARENADKNFAIEEALNKVSAILPKEIIEEYREKAPNIAFSDATAFCNEIKARVVDFTDFNKPEVSNRMSVITNANPQTQKTNKYTY
jgi:hypothetical protein